MLKINKLQFLSSSPAVLFDLMSIFFICLIKIELFLGRILNIQIDLLP